MLFRSVKGFGIVNKAKIDVFLKLSCFFDDPMDVGNLILQCPCLENPMDRGAWRATVHGVTKNWYFVRGTRDQIANICWIIEKAREFQKNIYFCFIDYAKAFDCVDHNKLWKILKEM